MDPNQMGVAGQPVPNQPIMSNMPEFGVQPQAQAAANQPIAQPAPQPVAQPMPEQVVATETLSMEQQMEAAMQEPVVETQAPEPMPVEAPKKKSHGLVICLIAALLVAAGGIGFGIYMLISGQQTEDRYKKQISSLQSTINQMQSSESEVIVVTTPDSEEVELASPTNVDPADYVYVGEWGMKIAIPEGLSTVGYTFSQNAGATSIGISGVNCATEGQCQYFPAFGSAVLGMVNRVSTNTSSESLGNVGTALFSDDEYTYYYLGPQAATSTDENEATWEESTTQMIRDMLTNPENYSAI